MPAPRADVAALQARADLLAAARQCCAAPGHFDELRGCAGSDAAQSAIESIAGHAPFTGYWAEFLAQIGDLDSPAMDLLAQRLQRQIRDNGVTYNVYADAEGPQRPWSLDLFPLILDAPSWQRIQAGVCQRMQLLEAVLDDAYGAQTFVKNGLLPSALVHGHAGYLRALHGVPPVGGRRLLVAGFDLARGPDGQWWVVGQRCQAPSGLGYLLENRLAVSRQFPQAFQSLRVEHLAQTYRTLMDSLRALSPAGDEAHLALLTPGPYNETYFEHAYLARHLGLTLVEGGDLVVRNERLYLKTLHGLQQIHGLLKRVDDQYLDPLELRADSTLGVPGLLQAVRAGHVLIANHPGSAFLESAALLGFLPALCRQVLGTELIVPSLPTWWCGERSARDEVLPRLGELTLQPTYPGAPLAQGMDILLGRKLSEQARQSWVARIERQGEDFTLQGDVALSQMPTWRSATEQVPAAMVARSSLLRVFAVADAPRSSADQPRWCVLPGGLARVAASQVQMASMQRGGSSADVWVLGSAGLEAGPSQTPNELAPVRNTHRRRIVTSRAAENLYWLGRYTERTENSARMAQLALEVLGGEHQANVALLQWVRRMAVANTLVLGDVPLAVQARRVFERALIANLGSRDGATSVGYSLRALKLAAAAVRERLSQEHWNVIVRTEEAWFAGCERQSRQSDYDSAEALRLLRWLGGELAAITGAQTDRMVRDDGWRLLSIGRHVERLAFLSFALQCGVETGSVQGEGGFEALLGLFDSTITFRALYQQSRDPAALLELLVLDRDNPRSLAWVAQTLRGRIARLAGSPEGELAALSHRVPDPAQWILSAQALYDTEQPGLQDLADLLAQLQGAAYAVSDVISTTYFTHTAQTKHSLGH